MFAGSVIALVPLWATLPVAAQDAPAQTAEPVTPGLQNFQLDPARDPNRNRGTEREGPEVDNRPPVSLPGQPIPQVTVPQVSMPPAQVPAQTAPSTQAPARVQPIPATPPAPVAETRTQSEPREAPTSAPPPEAAPAPAAPADIATPEAQPSAPPPEATTPSAGDMANEPAEAASDPDQAFPLPWLVAGGALVLALIAAVLWFRRRSRNADIETATTTPADTTPAKAPPPLRPVQPTADEPVASEPNRPHPAISIALTPTLARYTMIGVTIGYSITLTNDGAVPAEEITLSRLISNARSGQEQELARFFAQRPEEPVHMVALLAPGESVTLTGEIRLAQEVIMPIQVGERELLIPVVSFSAHYRWDAGEQGDAQGYSGAAFIVGQENDPPAERMAPFRLDQGPKQFRSVGSRLARTALVR